MGKRPQQSKSAIREDAGKKSTMVAGEDLGNLVRSFTNGKSRNRRREDTNLAGFSRNAKDSDSDRFDFGQQKKPRDSVISAAPRPTRKSVFHWNPSHKTLRIIKPENAKRTSSWVESGPHPMAQPKALDPFIKDHTFTDTCRNNLLEEPNRPKPGIIKSTVEAGCSWSQPSYFACLDSVSEKGETSHAALRQTDLASPIVRESPSTNRGLTDD